MDGVGNFVSWQDLEWLQQKLPLTHRAVVVGGGYLVAEWAHDGECLRGYVQL